MGAGQLTMRGHDRFKVFDMYKEMKLPTIYEELSTITVIDLDSKLLLLHPRSPWNEY